MQTTTEIDKNVCQTEFACPICHDALILKVGKCKKGHSFKKQNGVLRLMKPQFAAQLDAYLSKFESIRNQQGWRIQDTTLFPLLPFISEKLAFGHWKPKQYDLTEIRKHIVGQESLKILDLGAWNGWLSNQLAGDRHWVTAVDYFIDERDGLGTKKYYPNEFTAIQMDLEDISILPHDFDLIIINRGLPYFDNFRNQIRLLKNHLRPGGKFFITGIAIYKNGQRRAASLKKYKAAYKQQYGSDLFFRPVKGYLDIQDKLILQEEDFSLLPYSQMWKYNLKARLFTRFPQFYMGVFQK